jgi:two-component system, OmpR family, sensor histidine kinase KdpD
MDQAQRGGKHRAIMAHVNTDRVGRVRRALRPAAAIAAALGAGTILAFGLEAWLGLADASSVYLLAVAAVAIAFGTLPAIATAVGGFLVYNFLFIDPRLSLIVAGPQELLTLLLLLGLGVLIGRLAGLQRDRAREAARREREARALFDISRLLSAESTDAALDTVVRRLAQDARMDVVSLALGQMEGQERVIASSDPSATLPSASTYALLRRAPDEDRAEWLRIHVPGPVRDAPTAGTLPSAAYRIELTAAGERIGSLWATRSVRAGRPHHEETRLLAAAADQMSQAIHRERLARQAVELEVARRSDELKSALLASVSHDLRTPLAAIRAAAGTLADPDIEVDTGERRASAAAIDEEAQRLNRLVGNLIDMSRIEGRELAPDLEPIPVMDAIESVLGRLRPLLGDRQVMCAVPADLPWILADAMLLDQVLANLLENVAKHTSDGTAVRVEARRSPDAGVVITIEDDGRGVPDEALPRLFERFYRLGLQTASARSGSGLGLAVVRGFVEAMGGTATASRAAAGGLRVSLRFATHRRDSASSMR